MTSPNSCPDCGSAMASGTTQGLCPKCLMKAAMGSDVSPVISPAYAKTNVSRGGFIPPTADSLKALFPHLDILETLGHGGMGAVYKANQTKLDRIVALKIIRPESAVDPAFAERFNREAKTLARLSHPNIVGVYDFGEVEYVDESGTAGTLYYFLMEFVDGANLRQLIHAGETQPQQALAIVPQICEALQYAHEAGIVHRDIKPDNILLDKSGQVKIADFGLAKLGSDEHDFTLTGTNQVLGTIRYMAPEQMAQSNTVDHRADIYSLGVVFYEMLTGEVPVGAFDPPSKRSPAVDARLDEVVMRALASDPDRRYQSASAIGGDVSGISSSVGTAAAPPIVEAAHWPGPSTIIDRGVGAVAGGIKGMFGQNPYKADHPESAKAYDPDMDEVVSGDTYVTLTRQQIELNQVPDVCMVCGKPTKRRVSKEFEHTPEWAGFLLVVLFVVFFPAGILAAVMLNKKVRMNSPVCIKHKRHWSNMVWFASTGWTIILAGIFGSLWLGNAFSNGKDNPAIIVPGILASVALYVIPLVWLGCTRVAVEQITDQTVTFKRASTAFSEAVQRMHHG